jgi:hypothetical protein
MDCGEEFVFFARRERPEWRRVCADDLEARESSDERTLQNFGDACLSAIEKMSIAMRDGHAAHCAHEIRTEDTIHVTVALPVAYPGEGHAIGGVEDGGVQNAAEAGVAMGFHHAVNACQADVSGAVAGDPFFGDRDRSAHIDSGDFDPEDVSVRMTGFHAG